MCYSHSKCLLEAKEDTNETHFDMVSLVLRRKKTKGKKYHTKDVLDDVQRSQMVSLDERFYIFRTIHNSPPYLEKRKKMLLL